MPAAGNAGNSVRADKAQAKAKKLKRKPVATGSRGDSGSKLVKPSKPAVAHAPGPPKWDAKIPVRPGAQTNRFKSKPTTQAQRTHVHKERIKRNKELAPGKAYVSTGKAVEAAANEANKKTEAQAGLKGSLAKKYAKKNPDIFTAKTKGELKTAGFSTDIGVKVSTNAYKDLLALGQTPVSVYHQGEPIVKDLAKGDVKGAGKETLKQAKVIGNQYVQAIKHPKKSFIEHPVFTPLMFSGVEGAVGRVAGATARSGVAGAAAKAAASTERAGASVGGTSLRETAKYSKDPIRKAVQVANEKRKLANEAHRVSRGHEPRHTPHSMTKQQINKRVDERIALNEDIRRQNRENVIHEAHKATKDSRHDATSLIAQGIVRADKKDIQAYADHLAERATRLKHHKALSYAEKHMGAKEDAKGQIVVPEKVPGKKGLKVHRVLTHEEIRLHAKGNGVKIEKDLRPSELYANKQLRDRLQKVVDDPKVDLKKADEAAKRYEQVVAPREQGLKEHEMLQEEQSLRAKLTPFAVRFMDARHDPEHYVNSKGTRISNKEVIAAKRLDPEAARAEYTKVPAQMVTKEGKPLTTAAMQAGWKAVHGDRMPAFVTHRESSRSSFNKRSEVAPSMGPGVRTGRATDVGLHDPSHDMLIESAARTQGLKDAADGFKGIVDEFGVKHENGDLFTTGSRKDAIQHARDMNFDEHGDPLTGSHKMVPINLKPFGGSKEQLQALLDGTKGDEFLGDNSPIRTAIQSAIQGKGEDAGSWGLIPEQAARRINQHLNTMGSTTLEQAVGAGSSVFRKTVLATSPTWLWGNVAEASLRSTIHGSGPIPYLSPSFYRGQRVMRQIAKDNPELAQIIAHRVAGGGHFSTATRLQIFRAAEQFEGTALEGVASAFAKVHRAPGPRHVAGAWHAYTTHVFKFNSMLERHFQTAMFGKALKKEGFKAVEDAAKGLTNTESQVRFGRMVDEAYGKYSKWSPSTRHMIATYTPFISWWLAAVKFVGYTLPKDHPVLTSVLASSNVAQEKWRKENKINLNQLGIKQGFLAGTVPGKGGTHTNIARYTPFGALTSPTDVVNTVLPQFSTFIDAGKGTDWKGKDITAKAFGSDLAGAYIPGWTRYTSAKKYGVVQSFNPYKPIKPGKKGGKSAPKQFKFNQPSSSGGFNWDGGGAASDGTFDWGG